MISPPSQLLLRNIEYFSEGRWAFINPPDTAIFAQSQNSHLIGLHQYHNYYTNCCKNLSQAQHFSAAFSFEHTNNAPLDGIVIYMPKSKQQLAMLLDNAATLIKAEGSILLVGENKAGIKSAPKLLEKIGSRIQKVDNAKHCGLYAVSAIEPRKSFDIDSYALLSNYQINQQDLKVFSLPGVFGHKQLDPGTELLLTQLSSKALSKTKGHIYDFACGTGVIACYLGKILGDKNIKLSLSDVSALAVYCAKKTLLLNQINIDNINIEACDGVLTSVGKFDLIVSNPPFHEGLKTDYSITENFIRDSFSHSNPYASISIVANKFLPYPDILDAVYKGFVEVCASNKYKVYGASKFNNA